MTAERGLALARFAIAAAIALAIVTVPPDSARLFAAFALRAPHGDLASIGWLGAALTDALYGGPFRYGALAAASVVASLAMLALVEMRARRLGASPLGAFVAALLAGLCALDALRVGGGSAMLALAAATLLFLEETSLFGLGGLVVVTVAWCNLDACGILAPCFALVAALGRTIDRDAPVAMRRVWFAVALAGAATLATPLGFAYPAHALAALGLDGSSADYTLWAPADLAPHGYRIGLFLLAVLALAAGLRGGSARAGLLSGFSFLVALASGTLVPIFGIVAAPIVLCVFFASRDERARNTDGVASVAVARNGAVIAIIACAAGFAVGTRALALSPHEPYGALADLARSDPTHPDFAGAATAHRVFCSDPAWCDGARADGFAVLADSRIANAPKSVREAQIAIFHARKTWRAKLASSGVDTVVARANSPLATLLAASHWTRYAGDDAFVILLRPAASS